MFFFLVSFSILNEAKSKHKYSMQYGAWFYKLVQSRFYKLVQSRFYKLVQCRFYKLFQSRFYKLVQCRFYNYHLFTEIEGNSEFGGPETAVVARGEAEGNNELSKGQKFTVFPRSQ